MRSLWVVAEGLAGYLCRLIDICVRDNNGRGGSLAMYIPKPGDSVNASYQRRSQIGENEIGGMAGIDRQVNELSSWAQQSMIIMDARAITHKVLCPR